MQVFLRMLISPPMCDVKAAFPKISREAAREVGTIFSQIE